MGNMSKFYKRSDQNVVKTTESQGANQASLRENVKSTHPIDAMATMQGGGNKNRTPFLSMDSLATFGWRTSVDTPSTCSTCILEASGDQSGRSGGTAKEQGTTAEFGQVSAAAGAAESISE